jgi:hypothetical protein
MSRNWFGSTSFYPTIYPAGWDRLTVEYVWLSTDISKGRAGMYMRKRCLASVIIGLSHSLCICIHLNDKKRQTVTMRFSAPVALALSGLAAAGSLSADYEAMK